VIHAVIRASIVATALCAVVPFAQAETAPVIQREISSYPFVASPERAAAILSAYRGIRTGISTGDVTAILGEPDEIRPLLRGIKAGKPIGFSYWYVLRRKRAGGSQIEKDESLVRVLFDLDSRVTKVDAWGL
jgi:hypothetical protein